MTDFKSDRFVVIGVGLIGGSVARALRQSGTARRIIGVGRGRANLDRALALGVVDEVAANAAAAVRGADFVLMATPVRQNRVLLKEIADSLPPECVLTDAGSTKGDFVADVQALLPHHLAKTVPGHPIAGAERNGVEAADARLFDGKNVVLTPIPENDPQALDRVEALWRVCGAVVTRMSTERHDRIFSAVSHLPHVLAYVLVHAMAGRTDSGDLFRFAAGGFRDFTRIAGSSPEMWRDISLANRQALLADLNAYRERLGQLAGMIEREDSNAIEQVYAIAREARAQWLQGKK
ncbi:MAG: prephenate dehydrogenase [Burkholderiales bacterium]